MRLGDVGLLFAVLITAANADIFTWKDVLEIHSMKIKDTSIKKTSINEKMKILKYIQDIVRVVKYILHRCSQQWGRHCANLQRLGSLAWLGSPRFLQYISLTPSLTIINALFVLFDVYNLCRRIYWSLGAWNRNGILGEMHSPAQYPNEKDTTELWLEKNFHQEQEF